MKKPYYCESFEVCDDIYDVWFYVTQTTMLAQTRMVPRNLTPLTFKNGILVGTGYDYYYCITRESAQEIQEEREPQQKTDGVEDIELEKALDPPKNSERTPMSYDPTHGRGMSKKALNKTTKASLTLPLHSKLGAQQASLARKVKVGMTKTNVTKIVGHPSEMETYQIGKNNYDIWFYYPISSDISVPFTFKNNVLVGTTPEYYEEIKESARHNSSRGYNQSDEQMQQEESDQNFNYW